MKTATLELLAWIDRVPRTYPEAIEVWRTTCPQHAVWEDALDDELVEVVRDAGHARVVVTPRGRGLLVER